MNSEDLGEQLTLPSDAEHTIRVTLPARPVLRCEWCEVDASISVNWECGHASAMCQGCFGPPDPWGDDPHSAALDILDWDSPAICPECAG